jgi:hypothetical protein
MCLVLRATTESEKTFYELLRCNAVISIKDICRKVPRKMAYKYLKDLLAIQERMGNAIVEKKAGICQKTSMPIILLERKTGIEIDNTPHGTFIYLSEANNQSPEDKLLVHLPETGSSLRAN